MALGQGYIQAFDNFINRVLIGPVADAIGGAVSKIADIGRSEVAGISTNGGGIAGGFREMLGLSPASTEHQPEIGEKLGRSGKEIYNAPKTATLHNFDAPMVDLGALVAPALPNLRSGQVSQGMSA